MDWAKRRKAELENQLRAAYSILIRNRKLQARIEEMMESSPPQSLVAGDSGSISSFLKWFSQVGALNISEIKRKAEEGRWLKRFTQPTAREIGNLDQRDPNIVMGYVKDELKSSSDALRTKNKDLQKRITGLRQQVHVFDIEEENRTYGRASVRLTKVNILMSILIPIATFLAGLILSVFMEAAKPEIIQWIRGLMHLAGSP